MSIRRRAANAYDMPRRLFTVLYGNPNVGKTVLTAKMTEETGSLVILTAESGHRALNDFPELAKKTEVIPVESIRDFDDIFYEISKGWEIGGLPVKHFAIDSFAGVQEFFINEAMDPNNPDGIKLTRANPTLPVLGDYNNSLRVWTDIFGRLAKQDMVDVTICAHVQFPQEKKNVIYPIPRPAMTDKVYNALNGQANIIGYLQRTTDGQRFLTVRTKANEFAAKSQLSSMPDAVSDDNFLKVINEWRASRK